MNPIELIERYYKGHPEAYSFLIRHSEMVTKKALLIAERVSHLNPDIKFIEDSAMWHDIGIFMTYAPQLGCYGDLPYICHGYLGREILEREGYPRHALVAERHVGVGLTIKDIKNNHFPIPLRDMTPQSLEEKIVCLADKFYSKDGDPLKEKPLDEVRAIISRFGEDKVKVFDEWVKVFQIQN